MQLPTALADASGFCVSTTLTPTGKVGLEVGLQFAVGAAMVAMLLSSWLYRHVGGLAGIRDKCSRSSSSSSSSSSSFGGRGFGGGGSDGFDRVSSDRSYFELSLDGGRSNSGRRLASPSLAVNMDAWGGSGSSSSSGGVGGRRGKGDALLDSMHSVDGGVGGGRRHGGSGGDDDDDDDGDDASSDATVLSHRARCIAATMNFGLTVYSTVTVAVVQVLHCVVLPGASDASARYLFLHGGTVCGYGGWQLPLVLCLVVLARVPVGVASHCCCQCHCHSSAYRTTVRGGHAVVRVQRRTRQVTAVL